MNDPAGPVENAVEVEKKTGHDLVIWSGGADSTLVLWERLRAGERPVRTLSIDHHNVLGNRESKTARERIRKWLKGKGFTFEHMNMVIYADKYADYTVSSGGLQQPFIWATNAISHARDGDRIYFGYIRGDDLWHYKTQFTWAFGYMLELADKEKVELHFPLEWEPKAGVIKKLRATRGLLSRIWYCEQPPTAHKRCGKCPSCKKHINALREI